MASSDLLTSSLQDPIDVAEYLFRRLHEVGVRAVHGVPGDYNLVALDYIPQCGLKWVGNVNELNAGYAADGYARVRGISALVTTFGVGELSAVNAIGGAYSEFVPVVHIVGCPSTISQRNGMLLHHTLGNGDFGVFKNISAQISVVVASLHDPATIPDQIDHALRECWVQSRPVYIELPTDMVQKKVEGARLRSKLNLDFPENEAEREDYVVDIVIKHLYAAKNPVILVDACAIRHRAVAETHALIRATNLPTFVAPMGKSAIDETLPNFGGVFAGDGSNAGVRERVESADLVLSIGAIKSDFNTAGFTYRVSQLRTIDFHSYGIKVKYSEFPGVRMNGVLKKLTDRIERDRVAIHPGPQPSNEIPHEERVGEGTEGAAEGGAVITHAWLWPRVGQWLKENDVLITETGTANFGVWDTRFPRGVLAISQVLWGSIGYATGACQGAALAAEDSLREEREEGQGGEEGKGKGKGMGKRRTVLFTGDGSFQLTAQEVSTMLRHQLDPIIFVICNEGYTIERCIHGWDAAYNDIQGWRNGDLLRAFGAKEGQSMAFSVKTKEEMEALLTDEEGFSSRHGVLRLVEVFMQKEDAPRVLRATAEAAARNNAKVE